MEASVKAADCPQCSNVVEICADGQQQHLCKNSGCSKGEQGAEEEDWRSPAQRVRRLLTGDVEIEGGREIGNFQRLSKHVLYIQLDVLCHFSDNAVGWKELSRWLKYEEKVEAGGRWSKPHVTTASLHALFELRSVFVDRTSTVSLDVDVGSGCLKDVVDSIAAVVAREQKLSDDETKRLIQVLLSPHKHRHRIAKKDDNVPEWKKFVLGGKEQRETLQRTKANDVRLGSTRPSDAGGGTGRQGARRQSFVRKEGRDLWTIFTSYPNGTTSLNLQPYKPNDRLMRKIPCGTEGASILIGHLDFLERSVFGFFRLRDSCVLDDLAEVSVPMRFIVLVLGPPHGTSVMEHSEVGRALALLFSDKVFCEVSYKATCCRDLIDGIDEFLDELIVLPPSIWDPSFRLEPPTTTRTLDDIWCRLNDLDRHQTKLNCLQLNDVTVDSSLFRSGRLFGGLVHDVKRRYTNYKSDVLDGCHLQCLASVVFLYFACIAPIVTFGGVMGQQTDGYMGTMEMLVSGAACGVIFSLFAGQPLIIVGATGPLLVFETIVYQLCLEYGLDFLSTRFWIGAWVFVFLILLVALDLSSLVRYITRFTEESFTVLISVIFIYEALSKLIQIWYKSPIGLAPTRLKRCYCTLSPNVENYDDDVYRNFTAAPNVTDDQDPVFYSSTGGSSSSAGVTESIFSNWSRDLSEECITYRQRVLVRTGCLDRLSCLAKNWTLVGPGCQMSTVTQAIPDVFLLSCVLLCGTFGFAMLFRNFRTTPFFPTVVRRVVADFAVLLAVLIWTGVDFYFGLATPKLLVPSEFKPTRPNRGWMVNPASMIRSNWWLVLVMAIPGMLATVLIFLDQQITAVIVNRKEHKLKKGHGYHLDLFVLSFLVGFCSLFGLPWFVAATVRAITHVRSLICESEVKAPGDKPKMLGIREQRVTGVCIHLLIGLSAFFTSVLQNIPMPVLYGVFLYMGFTSLIGIQFVERIQILFMPIKFQPDYVYLRHVKTSHVHWFTALQLVCSATMWIVKSIRFVSITFPLMLVVLVGVRRLMEILFSQRDLYWLDNLLPEEHHRKQEDDRKASTETKVDEEDKFGGGEGEKVVENDHFLDGDLVLNDCKFELHQNKEHQLQTSYCTPIP